MTSGGIWQSVRKHWWMAALLLFVVLTVSFLTFLQYETRLQALRTAEADNLEAIARLKANQLASLRGERVVDATLVSKRPLFNAVYAAWLEQPTPEVAAQLVQDLASIKSTGIYTSIVLFDTTLQARLSAYPEREVQRCGATNELLIRAMAAGEVQIGDIHRCAPGEVPQWELAAPLMMQNQDGEEPVGAILLAVDVPKVLFPLVNQWPIPSASGEVMLSERQGDEAVLLTDLRDAPSSLELRVPITASELPMVQAVMRQTGSMVTRNERGEAVIAGFAAVPDTPLLGGFAVMPNTPWRVATERTLAEIDAPMTAERSWYIVIAGGAIALATALIFLVVLAQRQRTLQQLYMTENALRISERKSAAFFQFAPGAMVVTTAGTDEFLDANEAFVALFGFSRDELIGRTPSEIGLIPPEVYATFAFALGEAMHNAEVVVHCKSGAPRQCLVSTEVLDLGEERLRLISVADISERKQLEDALHGANAELEGRVAARTVELRQAIAELEIANASKDAFLASISHELRTPLTGVMGMAESLEAEVRGPLNDQQMRSVRGILSSAERLLQVINGVLNYTSAMGHTTPLPVEACRAVELCAICERHIRAKADKKKLSVDVVVEPLDLVLYSDGESIVTVLEALLDNAVKFTPIGGKSASVQGSAEGA